jgi:hypothetical protein
MPETLPRWSITIHPADSANPFDAQAINSITVNAENVTRGELAAVLANLLAAVVKHPNEVLPTVAQVDAYRAEQALLRDFPADVIYVCQGESVWLNSGILDEQIDYTDDAEPDTDTMPLADVLAENGWTNAGATPAGAVKACEYARGPDALLAKIRHASVIEQ